MERGHWLCISWDQSRSRVAGSDDGKDTCFKSLTMPIAGWDQVRAVVGCLVLEEGNGGVHGSMPRLRGFPLVRVDLGISIHFHEVVSKAVAWEAAACPRAVEELVKNSLAFSLFDSSRAWVPVFRRSRWAPNVYHMHGRADIELVLKRCQERGGNAMKQSCGDDCWLDAACLIDFSAVLEKVRSGNGKGKGKEGGWFLAIRVGYIGMSV